MDTTVGTPSDLGIRVKHRRTSLGLSRAEVAERTGLTKERIEHIENRAVALTGGELVRLARALDTTITDLCTAPHPRSDDRGSSAPKPLLEPMRREECLELIVSHTIGRIAFNGADDLVVIPVNYCYTNDLIIIRTAADSEIAQYDLDPIAFELDCFDEAFHEGWSVLVNGFVRPATDDETLRDQPESWAGGTRDFSIAIEPTRITGRRVRSW